MAEFVAIAAFEYVSEAEVARLLLEREGVEVQMVDGSLVAMDPFLSGAVGGIKLEVPAKQAETASFILDSFRAAKKKKNVGKPEVTFNCDECGKSMTFSGNRRGGIEDCPHCHAHVDVPD